MKKEHNWKKKITVNLHSRYQLNFLHHQDMKFFFVTMSQKILSGGCGRLLNNMVHVRNLQNISLLDSVIKTKNMKRDSRQLSHPQNIFPEFHSFPSLPFLLNLKCLATLLNLDIRVLLLLHIACIFLLISVLV